MATEVSQPVVVDTMAEGTGSNPKLFYFNFRGRAELVRLVMAAGGMKFEDVRFQREEWPTYKTDAPFGQSPYMELNGKRYAQSVALANWAAKETGLYGKSNLEQLEIDQVVLLTEDFIGIVAKFFNEQDKDKQMEALTKMKEQDCPRFFGFFEKLLKNNGSGFVVGNSLTLADIGVYNLITGILNNPLLKDYVPSLEPFPLVKDLMDKVAANEGVRDYEEKRATLEQA